MTMFAGAGQKLQLTPWAAELWKCNTQQHDDGSDTYGCPSQDRQQVEHKAETGEAQERELEPAAGQLGPTEDPQDRPTHRCEKHRVGTHKARTHAACDVLWSLLASTFRVTGCLGSSGTCQSCALAGSAARTASSVGPGAVKEASSWTKMWKCSRTGSGITSRAPVPPPPSHRDPPTLRRSAVGGQCSVVRFSSRL